MSDRGVTVTVKCSGCYEFLGGEDTEDHMREPLVVVNAREYQEHHDCEKAGLYS